MKSFGIGFLHPCVAQLHGASWFQWGCVAAGSFRLCFEGCLKVVFTLKTGFGKNCWLAHCISSSAAGWLLLPWKDCTKVSISRPQRSRKGAKSKSTGGGTREAGAHIPMASASSGAREEGEEGTHRPILEHQMGAGCCDSVGHRGGTWPERGRLGDTEVVSHRNHLRKGNFQAKLHLEHLMEKLKLLGLEGGREEKEKLCSWHKRTFSIKGDAGTSYRPRAPGGAHIEESAQEDREQIHSDLANLKKQKEELSELKTSRERRCQDFLTRTEVERQKIVSEFRRLRRFLKEQELVLLARLGELDREVLRRQEEEEAKVVGEISLLSVLVCEMEEKLERPTQRFLQDARRTVGRWEMGRTRRTTENFSDLERRLQAISQQNEILRETLGRFQDLLLSELEKEEGESLGEEGKAAFVTLDPTTAAAGLVLSRDRRGVRWTAAGQDLSPSPQRFDVSCCVLGCRGFTSGRHFWDVQVTAGGTWALGVARSSLPRKGWLAFRPEDGIWAVGCCRNRCRAFTSPPSTIPMGGDPRRIRVALDCGRGQVSFYLTARKTPIFSFQNASFGGGEHLPFLLGGERLPPPPLPLR